MKRFLAASLLALAAITIALPVLADSFTVVGFVEDGYSGPATGTNVTLCEYGIPSGFTATVAVPPDGVIAVSVPFLPRAVAFEIENDPTYQDVHILVAQSICPVSPCNPNQIAGFEIHLARRPSAPAPGERFRSVTPRQSKSSTPPATRPGTTVVLATL